MRTVTPPMSLSPSMSERMQRGEVFAAACPSREVLRHVTSQWGVLILVALLSGTYRFSDLRRKVAGVSEKMLAQTLQALEHDGFVIRTSYPVVPPHVQYHLSDMGQEVARKVESLVDWIEAALPEVLAHRAQKETNAHITAQSSAVVHHSL